MITPFKNALEKINMAMVSGISTHADFFKEAATEIVWKPGGKHVEIQPKHNVTGTLNGGSPIIFEFPYIAKAGYNFSTTYIKFKLRIRQRGGAPVGADNLVYAANGIGHTVWKNMELIAGDIPLTNSFQPYGYKKMIEHLLTSETDNEFSDQMWGYTKRTNIEGNALVEDTTRLRQHFIEGNPPMSEEWVEFIIYPNLDFFRTASNIVCLDGVKWELRLTPNDAEHCLNWSVNRGPLGGLTAPEHANAVASLVQNYTVEIDPSSVRCFLRVDYFNDSAYEAVMDAGRERGFIYNYTPTTIRVKTLAQGQSILRSYDYTPRANPIMYAQTFVAHRSFVGNKDRNPYLFRQPPNLNRIYNWFNGELVGEQTPIVFDDNGVGLKQLYINNLNALEIDQYSRGLTWSYKDMDRGFFFKIVSLKPSTDSNDLNPITRAGPHSYEVQLSQNADQAYSFLTYTQYETAQIIIHEDGTVVNTFMI